jgi:hypothetical protein
MVSLLQEAILLQMKNNGKATVSSLYPRNIGVICTMIIKLIPIETSSLLVYATNVVFYKKEDYF